ncbi:MAG: glycosyltransferase family 4 protein [Actinomycetes bacterium]
MTSLRVAYVLPDVGIPVGGTKGASVHVAEICRAFTEVGAQVTLVAQTMVGAAPPGVDTVHLPSGPYPRGPEGERARHDDLIRFYEQAEVALEARRPDVVCERLSLFAGGGARLATRLGAGRVVEVNAPVADERARYATLHQPDLAHACERQALAGARVVAVSDPLTHWARQQGATRATTVPNGVDTSRFHPTSSAERLRVRSELGFEADHEVVGFVGSLKPWHGIDLLLEAMVRLARRRPRLRLLVVGDGPMAPAVDAAASGSLAGRIVRTGPVHTDRVPRLVGSVDVAAAPYRGREEFYFCPLKVVEAMACAVPVVASALPPIVTMLAGTGVLVPPDEVDGFVEAFDELLSSGARAAALGRAARVHAVARYDWHAVARRILVEANASRADIPSSMATVTTR